MSTPPPRPASASSRAGNEGYAIPINTALGIARAIEAGNSSSTIHIGQTAFLGVEITASGNSSSSSGNGNGFGGLGGIFRQLRQHGQRQLVHDRGGGGGRRHQRPAQTAGLAQGDVITALGGHSIGTPNDLTSTMSLYHPGDKVSVTWSDSNGQTHTATVQLSSGPPQ